MLQCGEDGCQGFSPSKLSPQQDKNSSGEGRRSQNPQLLQYAIPNIQYSTKNEDTYKETKCGLYSEANVKNTDNTKGLRGSLDIRFNKVFKATVKNMFQELKKTVRKHTGLRLPYWWANKTGYYVSRALAETQVLHQRQNFITQGNSNS